MKQNLRNQLVVIVFAGIVLAAALNIHAIWSGIIGIVDVFYTLLIGGILAFVLNVPMKKFEKLLSKYIRSQKLKRNIAILLVLVLISLVLAATIVVIIPTLTTTVTQLGSSFTVLVDSFIQWTKETDILGSEIAGQLLEQIKLNSGSINSTVANFLIRLTSNVGGVFSSLFNAFLAIVFTFSILSSKEHLQSMTQRLMKIVLPVKVVKKLQYIGKVAAETYDSFLMSQIIEAFIIGTLIFIGFSVTGLPYGSMTGILAGVLSFIPYIGSLLACAIGALFIFAVSPLQALISIIVYQVIQMVEGNIIYPRVVGSSIGLPPLFTLAAATIGGSLFGLVGMIFFTPIFAVLYRLGKEYVEKREAADSESDG